MPLDEILGGRIPSLIKIDVEGYEAEVIAGAVDTLRSSALMAVILEMSTGVSRYGGTLGEIHDALAAAELAGPFWYDPSTRSLVSPGEPGDRKFNMIYVRDPIRVRERVTNAKRYRVHGGTL